MLAVENEKGMVVGEVESNNNLDFWDGNNHTCGSTGRHKGVAKLGEAYVLIHTSQWQGERDSAEIISPEDAVQQILRSGNTELFEDFPELQVIREGLSVKNKAVVIMQIDADLKKRWKANAELQGLSLTRFVVAAMDDFLRTQREK